MQALFEQAHALPLFVDIGLVFLIGREERRGQFVPNLAAEAKDQLPRKLRLLVDGEPEAKPELGVVFEQGVRPGGPAPRGILGPRCRR